MQFCSQKEVSLRKGNISHTTNYFYAFCLKQRIRHTPLTGRLARTLYDRSFKSTSDFLIPNLFLPVIFNQQLISKIYYPVTGAWPRTQNRRKVAGREKAERGGRTSEVLYLITASFKHIGFTQCHCFPPNLQLHVVSTQFAASTH